MNIDQFLSPVKEKVPGNLEDLSLFSVNQYAHKNNKSAVANNNCDVGKVYLVQLFEKQQTEVNKCMLQDIHCYYQLLIKKNRMNIRLILETCLND